MPNEVTIAPKEGEGGSKAEDGKEEETGDDEKANRPSIFMESIGAFGGDEADGEDEDSYNAEEEEAALRDFADHLDAHFPIHVKIKDDPTHAQDQEELDQLGETKITISDMEELDFLIAELGPPLTRLRDELDVFAEMYIEDHYHHNEAKDGPKTVFPDLGPLFFQPGWGLQAHDLEKGLDQNSRAYRRARNLQLYSQKIKASASGLSHHITMDIKALQESTDSLGTTSPS